ncbi:histidinol phosphate aminotransferase apoenzyme [Caldanaerobius fijiensis DSM 17918]|uniref:Histidinol-phosphate aminotransferase n=1 Tax=Caldanaerobius fijiensis DSM 17918 TaxID=1121256 RepID=A0A1M5B731_9THEO|nr:histidinol-phosphate transaminase [Caldanaerobius fijiensis]SHF38258.1 histidinol phosphate aminotransferase apoenzyme [Caldanaerobius fijiensis DSM 17918]
MIKDLVRRDVVNLKNYQVHMQQCKYKMDANESPFDLPEDIYARLSEVIRNARPNIYPDPLATRLRGAISAYAGVNADNIIVGNGSDDLIHGIMNSFVEREDFVLYPEPSFSMYRIYTLIAGAKPIGIPLGEDFQYHVGTFIEAVNKYAPKVVFLCVPNNPTGNVLSKEAIVDILESVKGLLVVDEAYYEFYGETVVDLIGKYPNLVILRTFSKAMGIAGLRVGYLISSNEVIDELYKTKSPYNINSVSQAVAYEVLKSGIYKERLNYIISERNRLFNRLKEIKGVKAYPSAANFILIRVADAEKVHQKLIEKDILVRSFKGDPYLNDCLRITVGTAEANEHLIKSLREIMQ